MVSITEKVVSDYLTGLLTPSVCSDDAERADSLESLFASAAVLPDKQLVAVSRELAGVHRLIAAMQLLSICRRLPKSRLRHNCMNETHTLLRSC